MKIFFIFLVAFAPLVLGTSLYSLVYGQDNETNTREVKNLYFQIDVPDNWIYTEYSDSLTADIIGFGSKNTIMLIPNEFSFNDIKKRNITDVAVAWFQKDDRYGIKNVPLEMYLQDKLESEPMNITTQARIMIDGEKAIKIYGKANTPIGKTKYQECLFIHNKEPYVIRYGGNIENYEKYLPEFDKIFRSFKFVE